MGTLVFFLCPTQACDLTVSCAPRLLSPWECKHVFPPNTSFYLSTPHFRYWQAVNYIEDWRGLILKLVSRYPGMGWVVPPDMVRIASVDAESKHRDRWTRQTHCPISRKICKKKKKNLKNFSLERLLPVLENSSLGGDIVWLRQIWLLIAFVSLLVFTLPRENRWPGG